MAPLLLIHGGSASCASCATPPRTHIARRRQHFLRLNLHFRHATNKANHTYLGRKPAVKSWLWVQAPSPPLVFDQNGTLVCAPFNSVQECSTSTNKSLGADASPPERTGISPMGYIALAAVLMPIGAAGLVLRRMLAKRRAEADRAATSAVKANAPAAAARALKTRPLLMNVWALPVMAGLARRSTGPRIVQSEFVLADSEDLEPQTFAIGSDDNGYNLKHASELQPMQRRVPASSSRAPARLNPRQRIKPYWTPKNLFTIGAGAATESAGGDAQDSLVQADSSLATASTTRSLFDKAFGKSLSPSLGSGSKLPSANTSHGHDKKHKPPPRKQFQWPPSKPRVTHPLDLVPHGHAEAFAAAAIAADVRDIDSTISEISRGSLGPLNHFSIEPAPERPLALEPTTGLAVDFTPLENEAAHNIRVRDSRTQNEEAGALYADSGAPRQVLQLLLAPPGHQSSPGPAALRETVGGPGRRRRMRPNTNRNWGPVQVSPPSVVLSGLASSAESSRWTSSAASGRLSTPVFIPSMARVSSNASTAAGTREGGMLGGNAEARFTPRRSAGSDSSGWRGDNTAGIEAGADRSGVTLSCNPVAMRYISGPGLQIILGESRISKATEQRNDSSQDAPTRGETDLEAGEDVPSLPVAASDSNRPRPAMASDAQAELAGIRVEQAAPDFTSLLCEDDEAPRHYGAGEILIQRGHQNSTASLRRGGGIVTL